MPDPKDTYVKCDDLDALPALLRDNYLYESDFLRRELPLNARVLQIGSMDGERIIRLLQLRPDLMLTGLEIEENLMKLAQEKLSSAQLTAEFIHGDITNPPDLPSFDYVICLNNTLGYIPDQSEALRGMKQLGKHLIISVYGEKFTDELAEEYFTILDLIIDHQTDNVFIMKDFTTIRRYSPQEVAAWGGTVIKTPVGWLLVQ